MLTLVIKVSIFILIRLALFTFISSLLFCYSTKNAAGFERNKVDSLNRVFAKEKADTTKSRLLCEIGMQYYYYDNDSALLYAERSYQLAKKINYIPVKLKAYNFIGIVLLLKGEYTKGEKIFKELISESNRHQDSSVLAKSLGNLGLTYYYMGDYDKSLPYFYQALTLAEKIKFYSLVSSTLNNIANVYSVQKKYDKALEINLRSLKLAKEQGNKKSEANILNSLGVIYDSKNDKVTALDYYRKSLKIKQELNDINGQISALLNISDSYLVLKNYDQAENYLDQAQNLAENINDQEKITKSLFLKGLIALNKNNYGKAETNFLEGAKLAGEIQARMLQLDANRYLYELYKKKNSYSTALKYLERYTELKDTVYNEESSKEMAEMEAKYENDKKQKEIQLLENQKKLQESELEKKEAQAKKNKILLITFVIGFVLVMISLVVSIRAFKQKQKANLLLAEQKNEIEKQNEEIQLQKHIVDEKQKEILDSINYAKRIQFALLASETLLQNNLPEYFVLFKPKDVVSGDFYWATPTENGFIYITADCTGHGVPGAFMSLLNISKLSQTINENKIDKPDLILNNVRSEIINALNPKGSTMDSKDGMDAVLCSLNKKEMKLEYAAANNSFYIIRNNELIICKADKMPVGKGFDDDKSFTLNTIDLQKNDVIYTFTDGYADQFGGPKGKKFKYKQLEDLLITNHKLPMAEQKNILEDVIKKWKGSLEQVDDILVIGVRV